MTKFYHGMVGFELWFIDIFCTLDHRLWHYNCWTVVALFKQISTIFLCLTCFRFNFVTCLCTNFKCITNLVIFNFITNYTHFKCRSSRNRDGQDSFHVFSLALSCFFKHLWWPEVCSQPLKTQVNFNLEDFYNLLLAFSSFFSSIFQRTLDLIVPHCHAKDLRGQHQLWRGGGDSEASLRAVRSHQDVQPGVGRGRQQTQRLCVCRVRRSWGGDACPRTDEWGHARREERQG